jgi:GNAT superfamily N-acetyltransferase
MKSPDRELAVRRTSDQDQPSVLRLLAASLGWGSNDRDAELFAWKHRQNPFGRSPAWVAVNGDGEIVGFRTFLRWEFECRSGVVRAARAVDTATRPDVQRRGVFSLLTSMAVDGLREDGIAFVFNTPNARSLPGYIQMGWAEVGRVPVSVRPRSVDGWAAMIGARRPAERWSVSSEAGVPASVAFASRGPVERALAGCRDADGLRTRRTFDYLKWRYGLSGLEYRVVTAGESVEDGAAVFRLRRRGGAVEAAICELLVPRDQPKLRAELSRRVLSTAGADYAIRIGRPRYAGAFVTLPLQGPVLTWRAITSETMPVLKQWDLTLGDIELF